MASINDNSALCYILCYTVTSGVNFMSVANKCKRKAKWNKVAS